MSFFSIKDFTTGVAAKVRSVLVNTDENLPAHLIQDSAGNEVLGTKTDAKSTSTDTTSVSFMQVFKQISASVQALVTAIGSTAWDLGIGTGGTRTQRIAIDTASQNANGTTTDSASTPVAWSTEGKAQLGALTETAPASDTASSGLNGRLQRIAQRISSMIALLPTALGAGGGLKVDGSGTALPVSGTFWQATQPVSGTMTANLGATTSGGLSRSRTLIPNNTTAIVVKSGAGQLYKVRATNNSGTIAYIKIYDATSATAGSGTPVDTIMIPSSTSGTGIVDTTDLGAVHSTGITYIVTTGIADADTTAPAASAYIVTFFYK